jgi:hypothetical protein
MLSKILNPRQITNTNVQQFNLCTIILSQKQIIINIIKLQVLSYMPTAVG